ncbi:MAG TPA: diacylglycerol kinase family protein [Terriglobales bacterium]|nr:diacylglycerol kinase family protein [Terriglobales bacterium]
MRAAVIFGPGCSAKDLKPFQENSEATWLIDLPATSSEADAILIFGGDGTVHRHLAQLVKLRLPVLVVPCGSGNDFARALNLRGVQDSLAAWRRFSSGGGNVRTIDLGVITPLITDRQAAGESAAPRYFCCVGGVGLDGEIARRANQLPRWLRAHGGYGLSLLPALLRFVPVSMKISVPGAELLDTFVARSTKPIIVAAFANAPAYGGGMKIAPQAKLDDGALDVCVIHNMNKLKLCCLFPTIYFGRHLRIPQVEYFQTERLRLETEDPLDVYADGEYVSRTPIEVSIAREALRVVIP